MDAADRPVELGQQIVRVVERPVGQDVDLGAGEQPEAARPELNARTSSIRSSNRFGETWSPKPWLAEWSVTAR